MTEAICETDGCTDDAHVVINRNGKNRPFCVGHSNGVDIVERLHDPQPAGEPDGGSNTPTVAAVPSDIIDMVLFESVMERVCPYCEREQWVIAYPYGTSEYPCLNCGGMMEVYNE